MVSDNIKRVYTEMFSAEKKVADYILENPDKVVNMNIAELSQMSETSDATIIRTCKHIGYSGFYQLKMSLVSENGSMKSSTAEISNRPKDVVELINFTTAMMSNSAKNISMDTVGRCVDAILSANMVYVVGWGNSGAAASDFAHRAGRNGKRTFVSQVADYFITGLYLGSENDVLVAISHTGATIHVIQAIEIAKEKNMKTILITNTSDSKAAEIADFVLSTEIENQLFHHFGGESHLFEMMIIDILMYFMNEKNPDSMKTTDSAEIVLSQYKL